MGLALAQRDEVGFDDDPDPSAPVTLDLTMRSWVDARRGGAMSERDVEKALRDWREGGMCTEAQAAAARAEASGG